MSDEFREFLAFFTIISVFTVIVAYKFWMPLEMDRGSSKEIEDIR